MNEREAINYINEVTKKGSVLGLGPIRSLLGRLNNPQNQLNVIHIAGTNGKGSICTFLEGMYRAEGKQVGRYISPTIVTYLERFQIDGEYMSGTDFARFLTVVDFAISQMREENEPLPTAFEIETAIAFLYFLEKNVDVVILETGMGGRYDATNVVASPACTVFASIAMDHMQFLGDTIEKIAYEKAGIMRKNVPAVCYPNPDSVKTVLHQAKKELDGEDYKQHLYEVKKEDVEIVKESLAGSVFRYKGEEYQISLAGRYQIYNAVTAICAKQVVDGSINKEGLSQIKWPCRFEKVSEYPLVIKDGAHNVDGVRALKESIEKHFTNYHLIFIIGVLGDKAYQEMMEILCPMATEVYTVTPQCERGLDGKILQQEVSFYCKNSYACETASEAMEKASDSWMYFAKEDSPAAIIVWGSLSYIYSV